VVCAVVGKEEIDVTARGERESMKSNVVAVAVVKMILLSRPNTKDLLIFPLKRRLLELQEEEGLDRHTDGRMSDPLCLELLLVRFDDDQLSCGLWLVSSLSGIPLP